MKWSRCFALPACRGIFGGANGSIRATGWLPNVNKTLQQHRPASSLTHVDGQEAVAARRFWVQKPGTSADTVWRNTASPAAHGGLLGSNINTNNKAASPRGFEFLNNIGDNPDPAKAHFGSGPLADRGTVDDATILRHLASLRSTHPWLPTATPAGQSDVRLYRVIASGGRGATVEVRASPAQARPNPLL